MIDSDDLDSFDDYHQSSIPVRWQACTRSQSRGLGRKLAATEIIVIIILTMMVIMIMIIIMIVIIIMIMKNINKSKS